MFFLLLLLLVPLMFSGGGYYGYRRGFYGDGQAMEAWGWVGSSFCC